MAVIDESKGLLVIRIVYDGPALSGKTTSLQALARGVAKAVETPAEHGGRTLFFDWLDYVGGLFDGRQIRCQIVSVPGQRELRERRRLLLESADAVVLVLDTRREEWDFGLAWLAETIPYCRSQSPPVGLVLQANKRDAPDALPTEDLRLALNQLAPVALVQSTANTGDGTREAFVLAVRLALDRVRALAAQGGLRYGRPNQDDSAELLQHLRDAEREPASPVGAASTEAIRGALRAELELDSKSGRFDASVLGSGVDEGSRAAPRNGADNEGERVFVPDPMMPGGMIWPPVDGRALLHEVAKVAILPHKTSRCDWVGSGSGFRFHSRADAIFRDPLSARDQLLEWARLHSANTEQLSPGRAVILADAGQGRLRLWQIVRSEATLRERLALGCQLEHPEQVADELLSVAGLLVSERESFAASSLGLPCTLWTVGAVGSYRPRYVGLMPSRSSERPFVPSGRELLLRELSAQLRELRRSRVDYADVMAHVTSRARFAGHDSAQAWLADMVRDL